MIKKLKRAYPKSPTIEPTLLPYLSEIGPPKICPIANPIKNIDKDIIINDPYLKEIDKIWKKE